MNTHVAASEYLLGQVLYIALAADSRGMRKGQVDRF